MQLYGGLPKEEFRAEASGAGCSLDQALLSWFKPFEETYKARKDSPVENARQACSVHGCKLSNEGSAR